jgi:PleD family two-component response regulator
MQRKKYRILIADRSHPQRFGTEKILNCLGCFGIAPVSSFDDFKRLTTFSTKPFDLVVVNAQLTSDMEIVKQYCLQCTSIRYILLYNHYGRSSPNLFCTASDAPSAELLNVLLTAYDLSSLSIQFIN